MANLYTHQSLALKIYNDSNDEIKKMIDKNKNLYLLGALGPDPLFFYKPLKGMPLFNKASEIHNKNIYKLLIESKDADDNLKAFLFGYITHFALDYNIHKYIYKIEKNGYSHVKIETELEKRIINLNNENFNKIKFTKNVFTNPVFDTNRIFNISNKDYKKAVKDMKFVTNCFYTRNKLSKMIVKIVLKLVGQYKKNKDLILCKKDDSFHKIIVDECEKIYIKSIDYCKNLINNYYGYLTKQTDLSDAFYNTFEGGLYEGKAN